MIIHLEDLARIRDENNDSKIVLTSGTFDLLHVGHLRYLNAVKALGDLVVVMISGDMRVKARKGLNRPVIPEDERAEMLDALKVVDYVFIDPSEAGTEEIDPKHSQIIESLQPDIYATDGPDPRFWSVLDHSKFVILPRSAGDEFTSTSAIIEHIKSTQ